MVKIGKKSISQFLRSGCQKQLLFSLYGDTERKSLGLPPPENGHEVRLVGKNGINWQIEKIQELIDIFGIENIHTGSMAAGELPEELDLLTTLPKVIGNQFIFEPSYEADTPTLRTALAIGRMTDNFGNPVSIEAARPDIIQVLPPISEVGLSAATETEGNKAEFAILPTGEIMPLLPTDERLRLRVVDVKASVQPGPQHLIEAVFYSTALAGWIIENNFENRFVVVAAPAIWARTHETSNFARQLEKWRMKFHVPSASEKSKAFEADLKIAPCEVFGQFVRAFFTEHLPQALSKRWQELDFHVSFVCKGCRFLGTIDRHPLQCNPTAKASGDLSLVPGLSRGAAKHLKSNGITDISALAVLDPSAAVFDGHSHLKGKRVILPARARTLTGSGVSGVIPHTGSDALMPRYPNLHVYLFADFDLSSAFTSAIGVRAFWREPLPFGTSHTAKTHHWTAAKGADEVFLIDQPNLQRECQEFLKFLRHLKSIFDQVIKFDLEDVKAGRRDSKTKSSTYQIYFWDQSQFRHFVRMVGRYLSKIIADRDLRDLAWLFPPTELLPKAENATRRSPLTLVWNVVNNTVATTVPHHYALMELVKTYHPAKMTPPEADRRYTEAMSDLIPAERIYEWWCREGNWASKQRLIEETVRKKVLALNLVTSRLETDLKVRLHRLAAPPLLPQKKKSGKMSPQGKLWLEFIRLNAAVESFDIHTDRAQPPYEQTARGKAARLTRRLTLREEIRALKLLSDGLGQKIEAAPDLFVYELHKDSLEVGFRTGEIALALAPESTAEIPPRLHHDFLDSHPFRFVKDTGLEKWGKRHSHETFETLKLTEVSMVAIDRINGFIALRAGYNCIINELEAEPDIPLDFSQNVILGKLHGDYLSSKVKLTLEGIGYPAVAAADARTLEALGLPASYPIGTSSFSPAAEVLWETAKVSARASGRDFLAIRPAVKKFLERRKIKLDPSQWGAWEKALSRCFSVVWGPPGTGKTQTLCAIILGAVQDAITNNRPLRLLITTNTYPSLDKLLLEIESELALMFPHKPYSIYRVQSPSQKLVPEKAAKHPDLIQIYPGQSLSPEEDMLKNELSEPTKITIVGCLPQQLHKLSVSGSKPPKAKDTKREWFDFIVFDEISQMNVPTSTLVFTKLAGGGTCVLAGDDLQLPPIHKAEPPIDLENLVGSAYNYFRHYRKIEPNALDRNYRSNRTIVELTKLAGYNSALTSHSPDLKIDLTTPVPRTKPADFPSELFWTADWAELLDPERPVVCVVCDDDVSGQSSDFEADAIASLIWLLKNRLTDKLLNERQPDGSVDTTGSLTAYTDDKFWGKGVGVVTPHRAQVAKIAGRLRQIFPAQRAEAIRSAVDSVEKFQGQQRDVIIASFAVGDTDLIASEDEFLFSLNRFNVLTSRSRAKLIVFATKTLLAHISSNSEVLRQSRFLKQFAESFCSHTKPVSLGFIQGGSIINRPGILRFP